MDATIAALRGKIGASRMESRIMESMLNYARETLIGDFENLKKYMNHNIQTERGELIRTANEYRMKLGISWEDLKFMEKKHLKALIIEWDTSQWSEDVLHKPLLQWYRL